MLSPRWRTTPRCALSEEFNCQSHKLWLYSVAPQAVQLCEYEAGLLLQMGAFSKLALEENRKIEPFFLYIYIKINGLPSLRQKLRITYERTRCHSSLFTRHVLPSNQDLISRSWPAGYFITVVGAGWCLWWFMPVGISYSSSLHRPYKPSFMRYYPI